MSSDYVYDTLNSTKTIEHLAPLDLITRYRQGRRHPCYEKIKETVRRSVPEAVMCEASHCPLIGYNPPDGAGTVKAAVHIQDNLAT
jgi:hypothetical protein